MNRIHSDIASFPGHGGLGMRLAVTGLMITPSYQTTSGQRAHVSGHTPEITSSHSYVLIPAFRNEDIIKCVLIKSDFVRPDVVTAK